MIGVACMAHRALVLLKEGRTRGPAYPLEETTGDCVQASEPTFGKRFVSVWRCIDGLGVLMPSYAHVAAAALTARRWI